MSDVFISYASQNEAAARRVTQALRAQGFSVWRDEDLPPHRPFSEVLEERLEAAKAVVVVWSADATHSQWVRAEADVARNAGKLVQVSSDGALPPLPFNQIHSIDLSHWRGHRRDPHWLKVVESVTALVSAEPPETAPSAKRPRARRWAWSAAAAGVLAAAAAGLWIVLRPTHFAAAAPTAIAVMPFQVESADPETRYFADSVTDAVQSAFNTNRIRVVPRTDAIGLAAPGAEAAISRLGVRFMLNGTVAARGQTRDVSVHVDDAVNHQTLWSGQFSGAVERPDELKASVAAKAVAVLHCSSDAVAPHGLTDPQVLMLYLQACDLYERAVADPQADDQLLETLRQVNVRAPRFAPAFAMRAEQLAAIAPQIGDPAVKRRAEARADANRALAIDPNNTRALAALSLALPRTDWMGQASILRRAQLADPDSGWANAYLGEHLAEVGRIQEAADVLRKATATNPLALDYSADSARMSALAGRAQEAADEAAQVAKTWPDNGYARLLRLDIAKIQQDWAGALALLDGGRMNLSPTQITTERDCVLALKTPTASLRAKARADALTAAAQPGAAWERAGVQVAVECLARMGFVDDAFAVVQSRQPLTIQGNIQPGFLFSPETASLRRDPRFMQIAQRIGLTGYWRRTGRWPDFCAEPGLPYDCRMEAARLAREKG